MEEYKHDISLANKCMVENGISVLEKNGSTPDHITPKCIKILC